MTLQIENLSVTYPNGFCAVQNVSLAINADEIFALVGESGCGKTTIAHSILGLLPKNCEITGKIRFENVDILQKSESFRRNLRGLQIGFVPQDCLTAFNPLDRVQTHIFEAFRIHGRKPIITKLWQSLEKLGIPDAPKIIRKFPHEWSGGMRQRALITAANVHQPKLVIADEPSSALDSTNAEKMLNAFRAEGCAVLLISHDLELVAEFADKIAVVFAGEIVEIGARADILQNPQHEYTKSLLAFREKNKFSKQGELAEESTPHILEAENVCRFYRNGNQTVKAGEDINLTVKKGEICGIYGTSGSGKSTLLRVLSTLETPTGGTVKFAGQTVSENGKFNRQSKHFRNGFAMPIFQNPASSLDARWAIWRIVTEPLTAKRRVKKLSQIERKEIARKLLEQVNLDKIDIEARPLELSIGQCQRVAIARALAANPRLILADEPTSALDASLSNEIMSLFQTVAKQGIAVVIVSHDVILLQKYATSLYRMENGRMTKEI